MVLLEPNISKETTIITPTSKLENCLKKTGKNREREISVLIDDIA